jgi:RND family efflux transporter MFP subunit
MAVFGLVSFGGLAAAGAALMPEQDRAAVLTGRPAQPVRGSEIAFVPAERVATYTGTIRPRHQVAMGFRVPGKIVTRAVEVGDRVTKGQLLARLDDTDAQLQERLAAAEDQSARVDHRRALAEVERTRTLFAEGHLAQSALDRAVSGEAEAASRADRAGRSLALARNGLAYTQLYADADGIVTATPGEVGQVVAAGTPVVSVAQAGTVDVVFALPETDRSLLEGGVAEGRIWGEEATAFRLTLRDISPDVDPAGRTYRVRMAMEPPVSGADLGRTVTVSIAARTDGKVAVVPLAALVEDGTGPGVWRIAGDRVERVAVSVASVTGEVATIRGPLAEGDVIVSLGAHKVDPTRPVRVVETYAATVE